MTSAPTFDYVIVGAGSAGCVLANRLSADPDMRVLLIEAGGWDWHPLVRVPLGVGRIWGFGRFDWGYTADSGEGTGNKNIEVARGKLIGGSHSINAMGYIRGHHADYDRWSRQGLAGLVVPRGSPLHETGGDLGGRRERIPRRQRPALGPANEGYRSAL